MFDILKNLCNLDATSGDEKSVRDFIIGEIKDYCEYRVDNLGNIIAFKKGNGIDGRQPGLGFQLT